MNQMFADIKNAVEAEGVETTFYTMQGGTEILLITIEGENSVDAVSETRHGFIERLREKHGKRLVWENWDYTTFCALWWN